MKDIIVVNLHKQNANENIYIDLILKDYIQTNKINTYNFTFYYKSNTITISAYNHTEYTDQVKFNNYDWNIFTINYYGHSFEILENIIDNILLLL